MKKIILGLVAILLAVGATFYFFTQPMVKTANGFFKAVNEDNISKVENYLSEGFRANTTRQQLAQYLIDYNIVNHKSVHFGFNRKIDFDGKNAGKVGTLNGSIMTKNGEVSPLKLVLNKEKGEWKIFFIEKALTKSEQEAKAKKAKVIADYTKLSRISMHYLAQSVADKNMTVLYKNISKVWQKEASVKDLDKTYGVFSKNGVNLLALDQVSPTLTSANVNKKGILTLGGYYVAGKNKVHFLEKFIAEEKVWKLVALSVEIK